MGQSESVSSLLDVVRLKVKAHKLSQLVVVDNRILQWYYTPVYGRLIPSREKTLCLYRLGASLACFQSLVCDGTVSGWKSRGDSRDNRSSTPRRRLEPPLASVEGKTYTPEREGLHAKPPRDG